MRREAVHSLTEGTAHVLFEVFSASLKSQIIIPKHEGLRENDAKGIPRIENLDEIVNNVLIPPTVAEAELHPDFWLRVGAYGEINKASATFIAVNILREIAAVHLVVFGVTKPGGFLEGRPLRMEQQHVMRC